MQDHSERGQDAASVPRESSEPFWKAKELDALSDAEWEALCDGCGKCCLNKLEDETDGRLFFTNVACRLLDPVRCRCRRYGRRFSLVPDCVDLRTCEREDYRYLPASCAYRRLHEGRELPDWHPLVSGRAHSVHDAGISVKGRTVSEELVSEDELEHYIVDWIE